MLLPSSDWRLIACVFIHFEQNSFAAAFRSGRKLTRCKWYWWNGVICWSNYLSRYSQHFPYTDLISIKKSAVGVGPLAFVHCLWVMLNPGIHVWGIRGVRRLGGDLSALYRLQSFLSGPHQLDCRCSLGGKDQKSCMRGWPTWAYVHFNELRTSFVWVTVAGL